MPMRSITDQEIALIKALLARGWKNRDIQFLFNRPDRAVNTGRISTIQNGTYSQSSTIPMASNAELQAFLDAHAPVVGRPLDFAPKRRGVPLASATLRAMFSRIGQTRIWQLTSGETDEVECKESFGLRYPGKWLRAVGALANNRGGYLFFGVRDQQATEPHRVVGLEPEVFEAVDPAKINTFVRDIFEPTPRFEKGVVEVGRKRVGVLFVERHPARPVIARKSWGEEIKEGDIFFRYPGQSRRISHADLRAMLDTRDAQARSAILPMVQRLIDLGPTRAMVTDLEKGLLTDGRRVVELDPEAVKQLVFIKEGEFDEVAGAPTLRLIGDVRMARPSTGAPIKGLVTVQDVQDDFLADNMHADPFDYLRCAIEVGGTAWLPVRFYARRAGMSDDELLTFVEGLPSVTSVARKAYRTRLASADAAFSPSNGPTKKAVERLLEGESLPTSDLESVRLAARAVQAVRRPLLIEASALRDLLRQCAVVAATDLKGDTRSAVRRAIARLDELSNA